ncbi:MAG: glycine zipper 2TM domain-containing protein [Burkholderiales bacterium]|nr:glycine zipper 2TM domain-containing protein [Burkholderiales bacterium]
MSVQPSRRSSPAVQAHPARRAFRMVGWLIGLSLVVGGLTLGQRAHAVTPAASGASATPCTTCGVVTNVQSYEVKGKGSGVGAVGGAVVGGLLGNQMGRGTGNTLMTVGGAVAGGFAGNEVEKHIKKHTVYKTTVKMDNGTTRELTVSQQFAIGSKVNVNGKRITARAQ